MTTLNSTLTGVPHDLRTWGAALIVLTLAQALLLNLTANLISSKLLDWWALRSQAALRRRRDALVARLDELQSVAMVDDWNDKILYFNMRLGMLVGGGVHLLIAGIFLVAVDLEPAPEHPLLLGNVFLFFVLGNLYLTLRYNYQLQQYRRRVSPEVRKELSEQIKALESRLVKSATTPYSFQDRGHEA